MFLISRVPQLANWLSEGCSLGLCLHPCTDHWLSPHPLGAAVCRAQAVAASPCSLQPPNPVELRLWQPGLTEPRPEFRRMCIWCCQTPGRCQQSPSPAREGNISEIPNCQPSNSCGTFWRNWCLNQTFSLSQRETWQPLPDSNFWSLFRYKHSYVETREHLLCWTHPRDPMVI